MADDISELLDEVESKYINSENGNESPYVFVAKSSPHVTQTSGCGTEELDAAIDSICSTSEPIETSVLQNVIHFTRATKKRCQVRFVGESASTGLGYNVSRRRNSSHRKPRPSSTTKSFTKRFFAKPVFELSVKDLEAESARRKQKEQIESLFKKELAVVTDKIISDERKYKRIKSDVWRHFGDVRLLISKTEAKELNIDYHVIHDDQEDLLLCKSFVSCVRCSAVFSYESHSYGTSTLRSHLKSCGKPRFNRKCSKSSIDMLRRKKPVSICKNKEYDISAPPLQMIAFRDECIRLQKQIMIFLLSKQRPFETVSNPEFQKLLQTCVKIGSVAGNINLTNILCDDLPQNLIYKMYNNSVTVFESDIQTVYGMSFSFEIWVNVVENVSYLSVLCYYSDTEGVFKSVVLRTFKFSYETNSGSDLNAIFLKCVESLKLNVCKRILVIDYSSNVCEAFKQEPCIYCICYSISYAVQSVIDMATVPQDFDNPFSLPSFVALVDQCRFLVLHFKEKNIHHNLPDHLHLCSGSCWRSILKMMESVSSQWNYIIDILAEEEELGLFDIDAELMYTIVDFLEIFRDGVDELASITHPTLNLVIPWVNKLKTHCLQGSDELPLLAALKSYMSAQIDAEVTKNIGLFHKLATMLDPRYKNLELLTETDQADVRNEAQKLVKECEELMSEDKSHETPFPVLSDSSRLSELCPDFLSQQNSVVYHQSCEVYNYLLEPFTMCAEDLDSVNKFNPLKYWARLKNHYPYLSRIASWILSCPASSVRSNERLLNNWMVSVRETEHSQNDIDFCMFAKSFKNL